MTETVKRVRNVRTVTFSPELYDRNTATLERTKRVLNEMSLQRPGLQEKMLNKWNEYLDELETK